MSAFALFSSSTHFAPSMSSRRTNRTSKKDERKAFIPLDESVTGIDASPRPSRRTVRHGDLSLPSLNRSHPCIWHTGQLSACVVDLCAHAPHRSARRDQLPRSSPTLSVGSDSVVANSRRSSARGNLLDLSSVGSIGCENEFVTDFVDLVVSSFAVQSSDAPSSVLRWIWTSTDCQSCRPRHLAWRQSNCTSINDQLHLNGRALFLRDLVVIGAQQTSHSFVAHCRQSILFGPVHRLVTCSRTSPNSSDKRCANLVESDNVSSRTASMVVSSEVIARHRVRDIHQYSKFMPVHPTVFRLARTISILCSPHSNLPAGRSTIFRRMSTRPFIETETTRLLYAHRNSKSRMSKSPIVWQLEAPTTRDLDLQLTAPLPHSIHVAFRLRPIRTCHEWFGWFSLERSTSGLHSQTSFDHFDWFLCGWTVELETDQYNQTSLSSITTRDIWYYCSISRRSLRRHSTDAADCRTSRFIGDANRRSPQLATSQHLDASSEWFDSQFRDSPACSWYLHTSRRTSTADSSRKLLLFSSWSSSLGSTTSQHECALSKTISTNLTHTLDDFRVDETHRRLVFLDQ